MKKALVLSVAGAGLLALSMPGANAWPLAFFAVSLWAWASLRVASRAWLVDAAFTLTFISLTFWWIGYVSWVGAVAAILIEAALMLPLGWLLRRLSTRLPVTLALPLAWCAVEFLRTRYPYGGVPFSHLGYALWEFPNGIQIADLFGVHAVSFSVAAFNGFWVDWRLQRISQGGWKLRLPEAVILILLFGNIAYSGIASLRYASTEGAEKPDHIQVLAVQANIPADSKSDGLEPRKVFERHLRLSEKAMQEFPQTSLILWPESAFSFALADGVREESTVIVPGDPPFTGKIAAESEAVLRERVFSKLLRGKEAALLLGTIVYVQGEKGWSPRNSAMLLLPPDGRRGGLYHKMHLVPGGEFVPNLGPISMLVEWLSGLEGFRGQLGTLEPGNKVEVLSLPWKGGEIKFGISICYDNAYADLFREAADRGASFHVVLSNEGWYGDSSEMDQLLAASVFRAIETRRPVLRATLSGISAHVDAGGRVLAWVEGPGKERKHVEGVLRVFLPTKEGKRTLYTSVGDLPCWALSAFAFLLAFLPRKTRKLPLG